MLGRATKREREERKRFNLLVHSPMATVVRARSGQSHPSQEFPESLPPQRIQSPEAGTALQSLHPLSCTHLPEADSWASHYITSRSPTSQRSQAATSKCCHPLMHGASLGRDAIRMCKHSLLLRRLLLDSPSQLGPWWLFSHCPK